MRASCEGQADQQSHEMRLPAQTTLSDADRMAQRAVVVLPERIAVSAPVPLLAALSKNTGNRMDHR